MNFISIIVGLAFVSWLSACSDLAVLNSDAALNKPTISGLDKAVAQPGDTISIEGARLTDKLRVKVGDEEVLLTVDTSNSASFIVPDTAQTGLTSIEFSVSGASIKTLPLVIGSKDEVKNIALDSVCDDTIFRDYEGEVVRGKRNCKTDLKSGDLCNKDVQVDCVASAEFPAIDKANVLDNQTDKFSSSLTIAGVTGTLKDCSEDGEEKCLTDGIEYKAAKLSGFAEGDIRVGMSVAGVTGTMVDSAPPACGSDGDLNCIANAAFPAVDKAGVLQANASKIRSDLTIAGVPGALNDCSADGAVGCVAIGPGYAAAALAGASAKILTGQTLGGVAGTALVRPGDCALDGDTSCVAVSNFPAVKKADLTANLAKIRSGLSIAGVTGTLADCSADGATGCVAVSTYPSVDKAALTSNAAKIRSSVTSFRRRYAC